MFLGYEPIERVSTLTVHQLQVVSFIVVGFLSLTTRTVGGSTNEVIDKERDGGE